MPDSKSFLLSKTLWGTALMLLVPVLKHYNINLGGDDLAAITDAAMTIVGAALAVWGRVTAKTALTIK